MTRKERAVMNGSSDDAIMFNHFVSFCSICFPNQLHAEQTQQEKKTDVDIFSWLQVSVSFQITPSQANFKKSSWNTAASSSGTHCRHLH